MNWIRDSDHEIPVNSIQEPTKALYVITGNNNNILTLYIIT